MKSALPTVPSLRGLAWEDFRHAMEYAGLTIFSTRKHIGSVVSETSAAFAGRGFGPREHYNKVDTHQDEEADLSYSGILSLSFSNVSFSAAYTYMKSAFRSVQEKRLYVSIWV